MTFLYYRTAHQKLDSIEKRLTVVQNSINLNNRLLAQMLDQQRRIGKAIMAKFDDLNVELDALTAEVEKDVTVDEGAVTLLNGLSTKISELVAALEQANNPTEVEAIKEKIKSLAAKINASTSAVAAALVANTPAGDGETPPVSNMPVEPGTPPNP